jgi:uncharacterized phage-associated protein
MPFPAKAVANEFLKIAEELGEPLTAMKLQKLVFYAHGWTLALTDKPLVSDPIEAWEWGPVIPALYHEFKRFGNEPITAPAYESSLHGLKFGAFIPTLENSGSGSELVIAQTIVERIWDEYSEFTAARLSNATHESGTPWADVYEPGKRHIRIPNQIIKKYFAGLVNAK